MMTYQMDPYDKTWKWNTYKITKFFVQDYLAHLFGLMVLTMSAYFGPQFYVITIQLSFIRNQNIFIAFEDVGSKISPILSRTQCNDTLMHTIRQWTWHHVR